MNEIVNAVSLQFWIGVSLWFLASLVVLGFMHWGMWRIYHDKPVLHRNKSKTK